MPRGFSLLEVLAVLAIAGLLLGSAVPRYTTLLERSRATVTINWLVGVIRFARFSAITQRTIVTLCPSNDHYSCGGYWHQGVIAFTDNNGDRQITGTDQLLKYFSYPLQNGSITWRSFRNRRYLQLTPEGMTNYQNGNFTYCAADQDPRFSRQIIVNMAGRIRLSRDLNGDGRVDDRRGKPLRC
jgi:type IV fimbrial biogenesis protein FimT